MKDVGAAPDDAVQHTESVEQPTRRLATMGALAKASPSAPPPSHGGKDRLLVSNQAPLQCNYDAVGPLGESKGTWLPCFHGRFVPGDAREPETAVGRPKA